MTKELVSTSIINADNTVTQGTRHRRCRVDYVVIMLFPVPPPPGKRARVDDPRSINLAYVNDVPGSTITATFRTVVLMSRPPRLSPTTARR